MPEAPTKHRSRMTEDEFTDHLIEYYDYVDGRKCFYAVCLFLFVGGLTTLLTYYLAKLLLADYAWGVIGLWALYMAFEWALCYRYVDRKCTDYYFGNSNEKAE